MMRTIGLSQRIVLGSLILSLSVAGIMALTLRRFSGLSTATAHLQVTDNVLIVGSQIQDDLLELFQTQEIFDQFLSEQTWRHYFDFSKRIETLLDRVKELRGLRKQASEMDSLNRSRDEMSLLLQTATYSINPNFPIGAVSPAMLSKIRGARDRLHHQIRALMVQERGKRSEMENLLKEQIDSVQTTMFWVVVLVLTGGISFAVYLHRAAMAPLKNLMEVMKNSKESIPSTTIVPAGAPEMRELIDSFNQMSVELNRNQKRLSSMLSLAVTVAHEVRNPITAIGTAIQALQAGYPASGPDREIFPEILKEVYRVNSIISDLLVFSRPKPLTVEDVVWNSFIEELRIFLKPFFEEKNITFTLEVDPHGLTLRADKNQMHRVLLNLLINASDAIQGSGKILLLAEEISPESIRIAIEDSGPGIPETDLEKIFDPFFSTKVKGTGLGLAIVTDIIERHGGTIRALKGKTLSGARFEITLPRKFQLYGEHQDKLLLDSFSGKGQDT